VLQCCRDEGRSSGIIRVSAEMVKPSESATHVATGELDGKSGADGGGIA
jgi:hypothetical protein